jgi:hypothetical protein
MSDIKLPPGMGPKPAANAAPKAPAKTSGKKADFSDIDLR